MLGKGKFCITAKSYGIDLIVGGFLGGEDPVKWLKKKWKKNKVDVTS